MPPLPEDTGTTPADKAIWRVSGTPLVAATASGPLDDLRLAVTDLYAVAGHQIGAGNRRWLSAAPVERRSADSVSALLDRGAQLIGLAHTADMGFGHTGIDSRSGTPPNPAVPGHLPGGSTSGAASAVSTEAADIALGVDTTGSMRIPASYQGLYGFVPSRGAVSTTGLLPLSTTFDVPAWACRDFATLESVSDVLLPSGSGGTIGGVLTSEGLNAIADAPVYAAMGAWTGYRPDIERGPDIERADPNLGLLPDWFEAMEAVQGYEAYRTHSAFLSTGSTSLGPEARDNFAEAARVTDTVYARRLQEVASAAVAIEEFMAGRMLLLPATSSTAPSADADLGTVLRNTGMLIALASIAGLPSVTVPQTTSDGAPVGITFVGPHGRDRDLLATVSQIESERTQ